MATYTINGFRISSNNNGSYSYLGSTELIVTAQDGYGFEYIYLIPGLDQGAEENDFGIPEIEFTDEGPYQTNFPENEDDLASVFNITSTSGDNTYVLSLFDSAAGEDNIFFFAGTNTTLPTSQAALNAFVNAIDTVTQIPPAGPVTLDTMANTTVSQNDIYIGIPGQSNSGVTYDFGEGDDVAYTFEGTYWVYGGNGDDRLVITGGDFVVAEGGTGNDIIKFKGGTSGEIYGFDGDDKIIGDANNDFLNGGDGTDIVIGLAGDDFIYGRDLGETDEFGNPLDPAEVGGDFLYGGRGNDFIYGNVGDDVLRGNRDHDSLFGNAGVDKLYGGGGNDQLDGGTGNDFMLGENGNDFFAASAGNDRMTGGAGADTFQMFTSMNYDTILDFELGVDRIDLSGFVNANDFTDLSDVLDVASDRSSGVRLDLAANATLMIAGITEADLSANDFIF